MIDWQQLPLVEVDLERLVWPCHDIDPGHLHPERLDVSSGPIHVEQLVEGSLFVHDGRHRSIRARAAGRRSIAARLLVRSP